jgi:hypothetical protein
MPPGQPCRCRSRTPEPDTAAHRRPLPRPSRLLRTAGQLACGPGIRGRTEQSNPRARSDNERPEEADPSVRLTNGLDRAKRTTTSRAARHHFHAGYRRRASDTPTDRKIGDPAGTPNRPARHGPARRLFSRLRGVTGRDRATDLTSWNEVHCSGCALTSLGEGALLGATGVVAGVRVPCGVCCHHSRRRATG